jgi:leader peptidase (prepilin peptidase) / N-methyltransferase
MGIFNTIDFIRGLLVVVLVYLSYVDIRSFRLPNVITLPLIVTGLCFNTFSQLRFVNLESALWGAILGYGLLWSLNALYRFIKKQDGIGMGDAKLLAALGAWLGWSALPSLLLIASLTGIIGGLIYLQWQKQNTRDAFPFGPFLAFAGIMELLWPQIIPPLLLGNLS